MWIYHRRSQLGTRKRLVSFHNLPVALPSWRIGERARADRRARGFLEAAERSAATRR